MSLFNLILSNKLFTDRRRASLYSNFRYLKDHNVDGYEANIAAWKSFLVAAVDQGYFDDLTAIPAGTGLLDSVYDPENGRPLALDVVLDELVRERTLIPVSVYRNESNSIYHQAGLLSKLFSPKAVGSWVLSYTGLWDFSWKSIGQTGESGSLKKEQYVSVEMLEKIGDAVWNKLENDIGITISYTKGVFTKESLCSLISEVTISRKVGNSNEVKRSKVTLSDTDIEVILLYLVRDRAKLISDGQIYKVKTNSSQLTITQKDIAIANLRDTIEQVAERVEGLSDQIKHCDEKARHSLEVYQNKAVAKYALKTKKLAETSQLKALDMLANLELVLGKIDEATDQADIVNALSSGTEILSKLNTTIGGAEKVGDLMDKLKEQTDETDEIGREISFASRNVDEEQVEEELDLLYEEEQQKILNRVKIEVPTTINDLSDELERANISTPKEKVLVGE